MGCAESKEDTTQQLRHHNSDARSHRKGKRRGPDLTSPTRTPGSNRSSKGASASSGKEEESAFSAALLIDSLGCEERNTPRTPPNAPQTKHHQSTPPRSPYASPKRNPSSGCKGSTPKNVRFSDSADRLCFSPTSPHTKKTPTKAASPKGSFVLSPMSKGIENDTPVTTVTDVYEDGELLKQQQQRRHEICELPRTNVLSIEPSTARSSFAQCADNDITAGDSGGSNNTAPSVIHPNTPVVEEGSNAALAAAKKGHVITPMKTTPNSANTSGASPRNNQEGEAGFPLFFSAKASNPLDIASAHDSNRSNCGYGTSGSSSAAVQQPSAHENSSSDGDDEEEEDGSTTSVSTQSRKLDLASKEAESPNRPGQGRPPLAQATMKPRLPSQEALSTSSPSEDFSPPLSPVAHTPCASPGASFNSTGGADHYVYVELPLAMQEGSGSKNNTTRAVFEEEPHAKATDVPVVETKPKGNIGKCEVPEEEDEFPPGVELPVPLELTPAAKLRPVFSDVEEELPSDGESAGSDELELHTELDNMRRRGSIGEQTKEPSDSRWWEEIFNKSLRNRSTSQWSIAANSSRNRRHNPAPHRSPRQQARTQELEQMHDMFVQQVLGKQPSPGDGGNSTPTGQPQRSISTSIIAPEETGEEADAPFQCSPTLAAKIVQWMEETQEALPIA